ncbi:hypothetical protein [Streptomyces abyssomicinicus]|uniref:hypothetical protein n=1 Tax=Streptomyces abyssomicinicus TaxID=574929 RepID=UPI0013E0975B|nr:hypothetical protein [Streptomyces abyssomicinicus]
MTARTVPALRTAGGARRIRTAGVRAAGTVRPDRTTRTAGADVNAGTGAEHPQRR